MSSELVVAVLVGVLSSVITGGAGLIGISWNIRRSEKHRQLDASRATHGTAVNACEKANEWIERSIFLTGEVMANQGDGPGSFYHLQAPLEIFEERESALSEVRSDLYRVAMGNADATVRERAELLRFQMGEQSLPFAYAMQFPERVENLRMLSGRIISLQEPLRELEAAVVSAIDGST